MAREGIQDFLNDLNTADAAKLQVLLRQFATAEDMADFFKMTREVHKEQDRRRWVWDILKKTAAAIVLFAGAVTAVWNLMGTWWGTR